ncbi:MAG: glycosyltransferase family 4 protein [Candidatus Nealsonbacteria bacterium]|nr:glycosyltransferase family 4 protein [Candidatus Nealsonbacteria bacterium]
MRILYVSQYFPPEMGAPAARVYDLSKEWVRLGHDVTVLTAFAHHPLGIKAPQDRRVLTRRERVDGIDVVRAYVYAVPNKGTAKRMLSYASFMLSATVLGRIRVCRPDVVIATSPQLLCGLAGYSLARMMRVPFVFEVRDLWPETMVAIDAVKEKSLVFRGLRALARALYTRCDRIVTVGEGYAESINRLYGIDRSKMGIVHNGIDLELFRPSPKANDVRQEYGWSDKFVAMYLGTHGMCHGLDSVLKVAREMRHDGKRLFVFVGEGAEKGHLKGLAAQWRLPNVQFIDQQPRDRVPKFYAACDIGIVCLRDSPRFREVLPSKIFEYLGMERPVLLSVDGEARRLVENAGAGVCVPPEDTDAMVSGIERLCRERRQLEEMGRNGRAYVSRHFDRKKLAEKYISILEEVIAKQ